MTSTAASNVIDAALAAVGPHHRPDLERRLRQARSRLADDAVRVLVVGEFKQGKSMLVNGLVTAPVCPIADDMATAVPTAVRHGETVTVTAVRIRNPEAPLEERRTSRSRVPSEELPDLVGEAGNPGNRKGLALVEVTLPRPLLAGGLELVDTPGVGGLSSVHGAATMAELPSADAVLFVSDAGREYSGPEMEFLRQATAICPNVACVLTKIDLYPEWQRMLELNTARLADAELRAPIYPVSSSMRWQAVLTSDSALNDESAYSELVGYLRRKVAGQAEQLARRSTAQDVFAVVKQLAAALRAEQSAHRSPEDNKDLLARLTEAQRRANELKESSARWQQTLNDGMADLNADIDHDLRERMREVGRVAEDELENGGDPSTTWDQLAAWVQQEVSAAASANLVWATRRARWLAGQVAEHFSGQQDAVLPALRAETDRAARTVRPLEMRGNAESFGIGNRMFTGLRGGYMGMLMFGMIGTLIGFASVVNPLSIGAGVLMGRKAIGDERKRLVAKRKNDAKTAVRRHIDEVNFQVGQDSRDRMRGIQRDLRDHFTEQADQTRRSLQEAVAAAERAVKASKTEREQRLSEIRTQLEDLEKVRRSAKALLDAPGGTT